MRRRRFGAILCCLICLIGITALINAILFAGLGDVETNAWFDSYKAIRESVRPAVGIVVKHFKRQTHWNREEKQESEVVSEDELRRAKSTAKPIVTNNDKDAVKPTDVPAAQKTADKRDLVLKQLLEKRRRIAEGKTVLNTVVPTAHATTQHVDIKKTSAPTPKPNIVKSTISTDIDKHKTAVTQAAKSITTKPMNRVIYLEDLNKNEHFDVTLCILVTEGDKRFVEGLLDSVKKVGLLEAMNGTVILADEITPDLQSVGDAYEARVMHSNGIDGISMKITKMIKSLKTKYVILSTPGWYIPQYIRGWPHLLTESIDILAKKEASVVRLYNPEVNRPHSKNSYRKRCSTLNPERVPYWLCNCFFLPEINVEDIYPDEIWRCGPEEGDASFYCTKGNHCNLSLNPSIFRKGFWLQYLSWFSKNDKSQSRKEFEHGYRKTWKKLDLTIASSRSIFHVKKK